MRHKLQGAGKVHHYIKKKLRSRKGTACASRPDKFIVDSKEFGYIHQISTFHLRNRTLSKTKNWGYFSLFIIRAFWFFFYKRELEEEGGGVASRVQLPWLNINNIYYQFLLYCKLFKYSIVYIYLFFSIIATTTTTKI